MWRGTEGAAQPRAGVGCLGPVLSSRIAIVLPCVAGLVLGAAIVGTVVVNRRAVGAAPSIELESEREVAIDQRVAKAEPRVSSPPESWCSTKIPPLRTLYLRGTEVFMAGDTLVLRVPVEGGEAILREANIGYCMLVGPSPQLEVATVGNWIVFATYGPDTASGSGEPALFRMRADGGPIERVAPLRKMPIGMRAVGQTVAVYYEYARIGESMAFSDPDAIDDELFEIEAPARGALVPRLAKTSAETPRRLLSDGDIARMTLVDGRIKVVGARGATLCTLVDVGSPIAIARFAHWVYFVRDSVLARVPVEGGRLQHVARVPFQPERLGNGDFLGIREHDKPPELVGWNPKDAREWRVIITDDPPRPEDRAGASCAP